MNISEKQIKKNSAPIGAPVLRKEKDGVVTLTLNRPKRFNALSERMLTNLQQELDSISSDKSLRIVILQGAGKSFSAGHDLKEMIENRNEKYYRNLFIQCSKMMLTLNQMPQPIIAKVHGIATAAGCQLVAASDLAVASECSKFATSGINVGLFCSTPAVPVSRSLSRKRSMELLLTGDFIDAKTALKWGLINRVSPLEKIDYATQELVDKILSKSSLAVFVGKKMFYKQLEYKMDDAYDYAGKIMAKNMMAKDVSEGIDAFFSKRTAIWKGL